MLDIFTTPESVAVLSLLMVSADEEIQVDEITAMLSNPFFKEHVAEKIGPHKEFLKKFNEVKKAIGNDELEKKSITALKGAFPALQAKTIALLHLIAEADGDVDQREQALMTRVMDALGVAQTEIDQEKARMTEAIAQAAKEAEEKAAKAEKEAQEKPPADATESPQAEEAS